MSAYQNLRCLLVDSDIYMRRMIRGMLRYVGVGEIDEARDGAQARSMAEQTQFNLIITELQMPIMDGRELALMMRRSKTEGNITVPIIGYTDIITPEMVVQVRDSGINEIIVRPFSSGVLTKKLHMALQAARPFIRSNTYIGPCRRRRPLATYIGALRRQADNAPLPEAPPLAEPAPIKAIAAPSPSAISQESLAKRLNDRKRK